MALGNFQVRAEPEAEIIGEGADGVEGQGECDQQDYVLIAVFRKRLMMTDALQVRGVAAELKQQILAGVKDQGMKPPERRLVEDYREQNDGEVQDLRQAEKDECRRHLIDLYAKDYRQQDDNVD